MREAGRAGHWKFHLSGGRLCLDLANTVSWRRSARPIERLRDYGDLIAWARQARVSTEEEARRLRRETTRHPRQAATALRGARALREVMYRVFAALADSRDPSRGDVAYLDALVNDALRHLHLVRTRDGFAVTWPPSAGLFMRPVWAAARSAAEVMTSDDLRRLKTCPSADCGWVFLDTTRNATRRWCVMSVCGNRAKARRYYARQRRKGPRPVRTR